MIYLSYPKEIKGNQGREDNQEFVIDIEEKPLYHEIKETKWMDYEDNYEAIYIKVPQGEAC